MKKYYIGKGNWSDHNWFYGNDVPVGLPDGFDEVILDSRADITIGYTYTKWKTKWYKLLDILEHITFGLFKSPEPWFETKCKTITFDGANVVIKNKVNFTPTPTVITYISGMICTSEKFTR